MNLGSGKGQDLFLCNCKPIMASESIATNAPSNWKSLQWLIGGWNKTKVKFGFTLVIYLVKDWC
jgi:hypothetical protein